MRISTNGYKVSEEVATSELIKLINSAKIRCSTTAFQEHFFEVDIEVKPGLYVVLPITKWKKVPLNERLNVLSTILQADVSAYNYSCLQAAMLCGE